MLLLPLPFPGSRINCDSSSVHPFFLSLLSIYWDLVWPSLSVYVFYYAFLLSSFSHSYDTCHSYYLVLLLLSSWFRRPFRERLLLPLCLQIRTLAVPFVFYLGSSGSHVSFLLFAVRLSAGVILSSCRASTRFLSGVQHLDARFAVLYVLFCPFVTFLHFLTAVIGVHILLKVSLCYPQCPYSAC